MSYRINSIISSSLAVVSMEKRLSICHESNGFSFSLRAKDKLVSIGNIVMDEGMTLAQLLASVKSALNEAGITSFGADNAELIVTTEQFVWIPDNLYDSDKDSTYLNAVCKQQQGTTVCHDYNTALDAHIVFAADSAAVTAFKVAVPGLKIRCQHSVLADACMRMGGKDKSLIVVNVRSGKSDFALLNDCVLQLSNTYDCLNFEEVVYHTINLQRQFHLNDKPVGLMLCGDITHDNFDRMSEFFENVDLYNGLPLVLTAREMRPVANYKNALILS